MNEQTLVIIKPDAVRRTLIGEIISRFEKAGFYLTFYRLWIKQEQAAELYKPHEGKEFYDTLIRFMCGGESIAVCAERDNAVEHARKLIGADGQPLGSIRGDLATGVTENVVHASDSLESAVREIPLFFDIQLPSLKRPVIQARGFETPDKTEENRLQLLQEALETFKCDTEEELSQRFGEGSYGAFEVTDRIHIANEGWHRHIADHPNLLLNPEHFRQAQIIGEMMGDLYQQVATKVM